MNISHIEEQSFIYGPGCRFVVWVQGCSIHCKGCWNKEMWSFKAKNEVTVSELLDRIMNEVETIEGITLLGGEPLDQLEEVSKLLKECKNRGISTMLFTGYDMNEIKNQGIVSILEFTDILITGRYEKSNRTLNHQWIGSTNQEIHFLTDLYKSYQAINGNYVEVAIDEYGALTYLGFPQENLID